MPRLSAALDLTASSELPGQTPVIVPADAATADPGAVRVALLLSGLVLAEYGERSARITAMTNSEREGAATRARRISPQAARGQRLIDDGVALIYGQLLRPPFELSADAEGLRLNGVSIYPSPGAVVDWPAPDAARLDLYSRLELVERRWAHERQTLGEERAADRFRHSLEALPEVLATRWVKPRILSARFADGREELYFLDQRRRDLEAYDPALAHQRFAELAADLERLLSEGGCVIAGASYFLTHHAMPAADLAARLEAILASPEPEALKLARLQVRLGHRHAAADLLYARSGGN
jgi:hypothetical protein